MPKEMLLTVRMDADLHRAFMDAAHSMDRKASQVARDLVRDFVQRHSRLSEFDDAMLQHEAKLAGTVPQATDAEYQRFVAAQVDIGDQQIAAGHGVTHEQVLAEGAARRAALRKRFGVK